jgi:hypothetical protein
VLIGRDKKETPLVDRAKQHPKAQGRDQAYVDDVGKRIKAMSVQVLPIYNRGGAATKPQREKGKEKDEDVMSRVTQIKKDLARVQPELEALNDWLRKHPPRSMQITPDVPELGPPPVLAQPRAPTEKKLPVSKQRNPAPAGESSGR